jgi:hypothetical protein
VELDRVEVLARVKRNELKLVNAARLIGVCYRQVKRLWQRYRKEGPEGLKHGNAGKRSNRAKEEEFRVEVLQLVREKYSGGEGERFGPTLAAEHLESEDRLKVNAETLRRWMMEEGLWSRQWRRRAHRKRRERRKHFGELVQLDGSFHDWFEGRGPIACLMNMVDDATGRGIGLFAAQETTWAAAGVLQLWIRQYGVPLALYTDWKNVYVRKATEKEEQRGEVPLTHFGRMCQQLGIRIIAASSPQAKGRVERHHGTHQDRLIKKLRRKGIRTIQQANEYLRNEYYAEHNRRFGKGPAAAEDFHRQAPARQKLVEVFRLEEQRSLSNDWVVRYHNRWLQVERQSQHYAPAEAKVQVCEYEDGTLEIYYRNQKLQWREIAAPAKTVAEEKPAKNRGNLGYSRPRPSAEHPWRQSYKRMRLGKKWMVENKQPPGRVASSATP